MTTKVQKDSGANFIALNIQLILNPIYRACQVGSARLILRVWELDEGEFEPAPRNVLLKRKNLAITLAQESPCVSVEFISPKLTKIVLIVAASFMKLDNELKADDPQEIEMMIWEQLFC